VVAPKNEVILYQRPFKSQRVEAGNPVGNGVRFW
jgi:hypothetical protein